MSDDSIEKIRERIAKLKEKSAGITGKIEPPPEKIESTQPVRTELNQKIEYLETRIKNLEQEKEALGKTLSETDAGTKRLKEKITVLENEKENLVEKIEKQERDVWIRFSLGIMQNYVSELFRCLRHTSSMADEAIDICLASPDINESNKKKIEVIKDMYKKTLQLIEQSKIRFTFPELKKSSVAINDTINNIISHLSDTTGGKISFHTKIPKPGLKIIADQPLLEEMLSNILQNAVESIDKQGSVDINVKEQQGNIIMEISDTGVGIPPNLISKVFSPFFTTKNEGGSISHAGLGLTRAYWICQLHRGEIAIESQMKKGTKVSITLPGGDEDAAS